MKIDGLDPTEGKPVGKPKSIEPVKGPAFHELLDSFAKQGQTAKTGSAPPISSIPFIQPPVLTGTDSARLDIVKRIDNILTDLDMFGNALGNMDVSLERLQPLADELADRKDELASWLNSVSDDELKGLISNTIELVIDQMNRYHAGYAA